MWYPADSKSHENREQGKDQEVLQKSSCYSALKNWKIVCNASIEQLPLKAKIIGPFLKLFHSLLMWARVCSKYLTFFIEFGLWVKKCNFFKNHTFCGYYLTMSCLKVTLSTNNKIFNMGILFQFVKTKEVLVY